MSSVALTLSQKMFSTNTNMFYFEQNQYLRPKPIFVFDQNINAEDNVVVANDFRLLQMSLQMACP